MKTSGDLPEISGLHIVGSQAEFTICLPENLLYFQGHFPEEPILPGVVQIHWAMLLGQRLLNSSKKFIGMSQIKFHMPAKPGDELDVFLDWNLEKSLLCFRYSLAKKVVSSGRIRLG